jgi:hypothetical protein
LAAVAVAVVGTPMLVADLQDRGLLNQAARVDHLLEPLAVQVGLRHLLERLFVELVEIQRQQTLALAVAELVEAPIQYKETTLLVARMVEQAAVAKF